MADQLSTYCTDEHVCIIFTVRHRPDVCYSLALLVVLRHFWNVGNSACRGKSWEPETS